MSVLLVTYDLNTPGQNHAKVLEYIKKAPGWARLSESCYAIQTAASADVVRDDIRKLIDANDNVYVITLTRPYAGFGPSAVNDWLESTLPLQQWRAA